MEMLQTGDIGNRSDRRHGLHITHSLQLAAVSRLFAGRISGSGPLTAASLSSDGRKGLMDLWTTLRVAHRVHTRNHHKRLQISRKVLPMSSV